MGLLIEMRPRLFSGGTGEEMQVIDPVCKMTIDDKEAAATSEYKGTTVLFLRITVQGIL